MSFNILLILSNPIQFPIFNEIFDFLKNEFKENKIDLSSELGLETSIEAMYRVSYDFIIITDGFENEEISKANIIASQINKDVKLVNYSSLTLDELKKTLAKYILIKSKKSLKKYSFSEN